MQGREVHVCKQLFGEAKRTFFHCLSLSLFLLLLFPLPALFLLLLCPLPALMLLLVFFKFTNEGRKNQPQGRGGRTNHAHQPQGRGEGRKSQPQGRGGRTNHGVKEKNQTEGRVGRTNHREGGREGRANHMGGEEEQTTAVKGKNQPQGEGNNRSGGGECKPGASLPTAVGNGAPGIHVLRHVYPVPVDTKHPTGITVERCASVPVVARAFSQQRRGGAQARSLPGAHVYRRAVLQDATKCPRAKHVNRSQSRKETAEIKFGEFCVSRSRLFVQGVVRLLHNAWKLHNMWETDDHGFLGRHVFCCNMCRGTQNTRR